MAAYPGQKPFWKSWQLATARRIVPGWLPSAGSVRVRPTGLIMLP
jgi:hypothetical protein